MRGRHCSSRLLRRYGFLTTFRVLVIYFALKMGIATAAHFHFDVDSHRHSIADIEAIKVLAEEGVVFEGQPPLHRHWYRSTP